MPISTNQLTTWGTASLFYDLNGNMTSDGTHGYIWDARNRLKQIDLGNTASFTYDPFGRRATKSNVGTGTTFLYDGANPVQEVIGGTNTANSLSGGVDEVFQRTDSAGARSFLTDALGSTLALTDSTGTAQTSYTFEPFGNTSASGSATTNSFGYTGRELDVTGLYFYRARYYNPQLQRFISEDPIGFAGGDTNLYRYVWNSPTNFIDPLGEVGIGVSGGTAVEGGLVGVGAGAQGSVGFGGFVDTNNGDTSTGAFASGGAFAGGPGWGASAPSQPGNGNWVLGAYAGGGASIWVSNANSVCDLSGPFKTYSINAAWGWRAATLQLSVGQNADGRTIVVFNYGGPLPYVPVTGGGFGASISGYNTNTVTTAGRGCGCK